MQKTGYLLLDYSVLEQKSKLFFILLSIIIAQVHTTHGLEATLTHLLDMHLGYLGGELYTPTLFFVN